MYKKLMALTLAVLLGCAQAGTAAVVTKWFLGSQTTVLSTELNSLANNGYSAASAAFNNTVGQTGDGYTLADIEFKATFAANPTANTGVAVWILLSPDGTNYEDTPTASITLGRLPDVVLPVTAGQTTTRVVQRIVLPWGLMKFALKNDGSGQAFTASGATLKIRPVSPEGV